MSRTVATLLALLIAATCAITPAMPPPAPAAAPAPTGAVESAEAKAARAFAEEFATQKFAKAVAHFDAAMGNALPESKLAEVFKAWFGGAGALKSISIVKELDFPDIKGEVVDCEHENGLVTFVVFLNRDLKVSGLRTLPLPKREKLESIAREFWDLLVAGEWSKALARTAGGFTAKKLQQATDKYIGERGEFKAVESVSIKPSPQAAGVTLECVHEKQKGRVFVAIDGLGRVIGLFFRDAWNPPEYADVKAIEERLVTVGIDKYPLPGTLTLPKGKSALPAVVLLHGSGPNDRDESYGPNKTFKDLAWGLASRGIAVLRYEKKTLHYQAQVKDYVKGIEQEYLEDVRSAVDLLSKTPEIDPKRIFLVGHSLGATVAPKAALDDRRVNGIVLLAGPTRTAGQLHIDQYRYLLDHGWNVPKEQQSAILAEAEAVAKKLDSQDLKTNEIVEGIEGSYWLDLRAYARGGVAPKLKIPILVAQGGRDYQVTLVDFEGWKTALAGKKNATFKLFPELNHHFMPGKGASTPQEYDAPNHVAKAVIDEVAGWIARH